MNWFYVADGQQAGPVSDAELEDLLQTGKIKAATLVWHEGMTEWQPFAIAKPAAPGSPPILSGNLAGAACAECGQIFPPDELITLNKTPVCARCKPVFLQRMAEGVATPGSAGLWRQGKKIVTVSETPFPDRCIKCNAPANGFRLKRVLYWQHPAYYLLLLCNLLILLIVVLIVRKKAVLHIGLCERHRQQRQTAILAGWIGTLGGLAMIIAGGMMSAGWLALAGTIFFLGGAIWGAARGRTIAATKIDRQNVWVSGAGAKFLDELPERPV